jgi:dGTPase
MNIRKQTEELEKKYLHPKACQSAHSQGREWRDREEEIRTCFQRDRDRIIHSKSFRRLKQKTQVFLAPKGDHYRTRLIHVLEVSQIARTIARALCLNEDLTEAVALGHDLGHTPFGHAGESVLREIHPAGFDHYEQSLRVVDVLERNGKGLNLTHEVRNGIVRHSKGKGKILPEVPEERADTLEGQVVRISDIIAYVNHDLDDALRAGVIKKGDLPSELLKALGDSYSRRIDVMVKDLVYSTLKNDLECLVMSAEIKSAIYLLRDFLFERVYNSETIIKEFNKAKNIVKALYTYYLEHFELIKKMRRLSLDDGMPVTSVQNEQVKHRAVCDFVSGMTDQFAIMTYERIFLPQQWTVL